MKEFFAITIAVLNKITEITLPR